MTMISTGGFISGTSSWAPVAVESLWKATLVLLAAAAAAWLLRRSSAALRHLVWAIAVGATLAVPLGIALVPSWRVAVLPAAGAAQSGDQGSGDVEVFDGLAAASPSASATTTPSLTASPSASATPSATPARPPIDLPGVVFVVWLFGVVSILSWIATGSIAVANLARRARVLTNPEWAVLLRAARHQLGVRREVLLLETPTNVTPMTFGLWSNVILLPAQSVSWTHARKRAVLLHELAHVVRRDVLVQLIAQLSCALYWFHPLVWHAAARLRRERERACDDAVVRAGERPSDYATHLLEVARSYHAAPLLQPAALAMARASQLEGRLLAVLKPGLDRARVSRQRIAASVTAAFAVVLPLSALTPIARSPFALQERSATVFEHPRPTEPLAARWAWAFREAARRPQRGFWVAYSVTRSAPANRTFISGSGGFSMRELQMRPLQTQLFGTTPPAVRRTDPTARIPHEVALMFQFERGATNFNDVTVTRIHSLSLGIDLARLPVYWLGAASDEQSIGWLRQQFESTSLESIRDELVEAVGVHERADLAVPFLQQVLREESSASVRAQAAEALGDQGSVQAVQALREVVVTDRSVDVRREAAEALGQSNEQSATRTLVEVARSGTDLSVRVEAAEALGDQGTEQAARALEQLIFDADDLAVQRQAAESLGDLPGTLGLPALRRIVRSHERWEIRAEAAETLGDLPPSIALPLLEQVAFKDPDARVQEEAAEALGDLGRAAIPVLRRIRDSHPNRDVREKAAESLADLGGPDDPDEADLPERERLDVEIDPTSLISEAEARVAPDSRAILALRKHLTHVSTGEHDLVRERAEWALTRVNSGEVVRPLIDALSDPDWRVRAYAGWALAVADDARAVPTLQTAAVDEHWRVRMHALSALGKLDASPRTAGLLIGGLEDVTWQVRAIAAHHLGEIRAAEALEPLRRRLNDSHIAVRGAAEKAIEQISG